jgi:hypothetical protein
MDRSGGFLCADVIEVEMVNLSEQAKATKLIGTRGLYTPQALAIVAAKMARLTTCCSGFTTPRGVGVAGYVAGGSVLQGLNWGKASVQ